MNGIDPLASHRGLHVDLLLPRGVAGAQGAQPLLPPPLAAGELRRQSTQQEAGIGMDPEIRLAIHPEIGLAAVDGDEERLAGDVPAVVQAKIAGNAGQQDEVRLA